MNPHARYTLMWLLALVLLVTAGVAQGKDSAKPVYYVYLAGPEVFLPKPIQAGDRKKATIAELSKKHQWPFELVGLYPMDNEIKDFKHDRDTGLRIYQANIDLMVKADFVTANMVRFRGPSMDVGTAFEMGFMRGLGKPVFAYYDAEPFYGKAEKPGIYAERVKKYYDVDPAKPLQDIHGQSIEDFSMADNLMMIGAIDDNDADIDQDFSTVIMRIASHILAKQKHDQ